MESLLLLAAATPAQLQALGRVRDSIIRLAVDLERGILAAGGEFHADCEEVLLDDGSVPEHVWGADLDLTDGTLRCISLINIKPQQGSRTMAVQDPLVRARIEAIVERVLGGAR